VSIPYDYLAIPTSFLFLGMQDASGVRRLGLDFLLTYTGNAKLLSFDWL